MMKLNLKKLPPPHKRSRCHPNGYSNVESLTLRALRSALGEGSKVRPRTFRLSETFLLIFRSLLTLHRPERGDDFQGSYATRGNWTYHVALSFKEAARSLGLRAVFEARGRLDGIAESEDGSRYIAAEWEWDYKDVFSEGGELEKLCREAGECEDVDLLLFTYVPKSHYPEYVSRCLEKWKSARRNPDARLYVMAILFELDGKMRRFECIRTTVAGSDELALWDDLSL